MMIGLGLAGAVVLVIFIFFLAKSKNDAGQNGGDSDLAELDSEARENRRATNDRLKQLGIALHNYHDVYGTFPPGGVFDLRGTGHHSWQTSLLPQVDQAPLFQSINPKIPWNDPANAAFFQTEIPAYCRASGEATKNDGGLGLSHWSANQSVMNQNSRIRLRDVTDGLTFTIMAGEVAGNFSPWGQPGNWRDPGQGINKGPNTFGNPNEAGALMLLGDGAVRFISEDVDPQVLKNLANHKDGNRIDQF